MDKQLSIGKWILALFIIIVAAATSSAFEVVNTPKQQWWLAMVVVGLAFIFASIKSSFFLPGILSSTLFIGGSSQLALTQAAWFQGIQTSPENLFTYLLWGSIIVQASLTLWTIFLHKRIKISFFLIHTKTPVILTLLIALLFVTPIMNKLGYWHELVIQGILAGIFFFLNLLNVIALGLSLQPPPLTQAINKKYRKLLGSNHLHFLFSACAFISCCILCFFAFERTPHVPDEVAYLFQAKTFALGLLSIPTPDPNILTAIDFDLIHSFNGKWFSVFPPGWPAILMAGEQLGMTWIINPALAALSLIIAYYLFNELKGRTFANIIVALMAISPWFITASASLMSHTLTIFLLLCSWLTLTSAQRHSSLLLTCFAGGLMGVLFLTRPLDGLIVGSLTGIWCISNFHQHRWRQVVAYSIGCLLVGGLIFPYHQALTGDPLLTPINNFFNDIWYPGSNRFGFAEDIGPPESWNPIDLHIGHSPLEALIHFQQNLYALNFDLFGWLGAGSLLLFIFHLLNGKLDRLDHYMLIIICSVIITYSFYWFSGSFYIGPRYWFITFIPFIYLSARGIESLYDYFQPHISAEKLTIVFIVLSLFSVLSFTSWRGVEKYHEFRKYHDDYRKVVQSNDLRNSIIFIQKTTEDDFGSAFIFNAPDQDSNAPLFVRDQGPEANLRLAEMFPERLIYFAQGREKSGKPATLLSGPFFLTEKPFKDIQE